MKIVKSQILAEVRSGVVKTPIPGPISKTLAF